MDNPLSIDRWTMTEYVIAYCMSFFLNQIFFFVKINLQESFSRNNSSEFVHYLQESFLRKNSSEFF